MPAIATLAPAAPTAKEKTASAAVFAVTKLNVSYFFLLKISLSTGMAVRIMSAMKI
jgi:hypothetical protein